MSETKLCTVFAGIIFDGCTPEFPLIVNTNGDRFTVRVRAMPARHLPEVLKRCTDEAAFIELTASVAEIDPESKEVKAWGPVTADWVDSLDDDCHLLLYNAAKDLNFTRAAAWGERQIAAKKAQAPLMLKADQELSPVIQQMAALLLSSLPQSASPAGPSTKS